MTTLRMRAVLAALLLGMSGCTSSGLPSYEDGGEPPEPSPSADAPDLDFSASIQVGDGSVTVAYELTNNESSQVFVPDRTLVPSGAGTAFSASPYVTGEEDDDGPVLVLSHRVFPWPPGVNLAAPPAGGGHFLEPGETLRSEFELERPLTRNHPFGDDYGHGVVALPADPVGVRLCVGVVPSPIPPAMAVEPSKDGTHLFSHGNAGNAAQHLFCSQIETWGSRG